MTIEVLYLIFHGVVTLGALIGFLIKNDHRITTVEVELRALKESHDTLTHHGTLPHGG